MDKALLLCRVTWELPDMVLLAMIEGLRQHRKDQTPQSGDVVGQPKQVGSEDKYCSRRNSSALKRRDENVIIEIYYRLIQHRVI